MKVFVGGVYHGEWEVECIPRLATNLGISVEEIIRQSEDFERKAKMKKSVDDRIELEVGTQSQIAQVTANGASIGLIISGIVLDGIVRAETLEAAKAKISANLKNIFGQDAGQSLTSMVEKYASGEVRTPVQAFGFDRSLSKIEGSSDKAYEILSAVISGVQAQRDPADNG